MLCKNAKRLRHLSTKKLLALREKAEWSACFGAEQPVDSERTPERGRLIPDQAGRHELAEIEAELKCRAKRHDPEIMQAAISRLRKGRRQSANEKAGRKAIDASKAKARRKVRKLRGAARIEDAEKEERKFESDRREQVSASNSAQSKSENIASGKTREELLRPILTERGYSVHDWAKAARVDFHTANNYLAGKTTPYPSTRKKLADALGFTAEQLPQ